MTNPYLISIVTALFWAGAPLLGRASGISAIALSAILAIGNLIAITPIALTQNFSTISHKAISIGLAAGIANGIGLLGFYYLVAGNQQGLWEMSKTLPIPLVLLPIGIALGGYIFYQEVITTDKIIGIALACGAIYFLNR